MAPIPPRHVRNRKGREIFENVDVVNGRWQGVEIHSATIKYNIEHIDYYVREDGTTHLGYNSDMEQKHRIKVIPDNSGGYILQFLKINWENGKEQETEEKRLTFKDKKEFLEFKEVAINYLQQFK